MLTEIQEFLGKEIKVINLSSEDYVEIKGESALFGFEVNVLLFYTCNVEQRGKQVL